MRGTPQAQRTEPGPLEQENERLRLALGRAQAAQQELRGLLEQLTAAPWHPARFQHLVETPMGADWPEATELWNTRSPMRRPAKPEDIADLVAALVANDYVTGEIVIADGGLNLT